MVFDGVLSWWTGKKQDEDSDDGGEDPPSPQPPPSVGTTGEAQAENTQEILLSEFRQMRDYTIGRLGDRIGALEENLEANRGTIDHVRDRIVAVEEHLEAKKGTISQHDARICTLEQNFERHLKREAQRYQDANQNSDSNPPEVSRSVVDMVGDDDHGPNVPALPNTTQARGPPMLLGQLKDDNNYSQSLPPEDPGRYSLRRANSCRPSGD
jgi:hypothetical protein